MSAKHPENRKLVTASNREAPNRLREIAKRKNDGMVKVYGFLGFIRNTRSLVVALAFSVLFMSPPRDIL